MARPTQAKEVKPKAEGDDEGEGGKGLPLNSNLISMVIMSVIVVLCTAVSSAASVYFLVPMVVKPIIAELKPPASGDQAGAEGGDGSGAEGGADKAPQIGPVLELDEFTVNLKDPGGQRYLRATLSISVTAEDPKFEKLSGEALKKWEEEFHGEMSHYVPAIRDICITAMTKRNASELSTAMGKEALKEEIQKAVDGLFHGSHKVIRVNLENFIIQ